MRGAKFHIEKFDGTENFRLCRIKMRSLLIQHRCEAALEVLPADMEAEQKLREVIVETTAAGVWSKLETLYTTKSLASKFYLKKLYTFYMLAGRKIFEQALKGEVFKGLPTSVMYKDTLKHSSVEDGDDEDAGDQETDQTPDLIDYQLVRNREPKTRTKPLRYRDESNMATYTFAAVEDEDTHEPLTYQEAVAYEDSFK
ncbi:hypothetical protein Tco_1508569 [Tanacetum coccineum]